MVTNYYNASNNFQSPIRREPKPYMRVEERPEEIKPPVPKKNFLRELDQDSILLLGLLFLLFFSGCDDIWLIVALGYLLFL